MNRGRGGRKFWNKPLNGSGALCVGVVWVYFHPRRGLPSLSVLSSGLRHWRKCNCGHLRLNSEPSLNRYQTSNFNPWCLGTRATFGIVPNGSPPAGPDPATYSLTNTSCVAGYKQRGRESKATKQNHQLHFLSQPLDKCSKVFGRKIEKTKTTHRRASAGFPR